jgi:enoyl-CoA hydratase
MSATPSPGSAGTLAVDQVGAVRILRLSRPERLNAINPQMLEELTAELRRIRRDESVGCVILTGTARPDGRPCFSSGVDLRAAADEPMPPGNPGLRLTALIDDLLTPSIAVIDGICTTGALELAMACDLRIAADTAQISDWHLLRLGSGLGGWGASTRLPRLVGVAQAKDLILTGKVIDGAEAARIGLAQRVVPTASLWDEAMAMAEAVAGMNRDGVRMTLTHLSRVEDLSKEEALSFAVQVRELFAGRGTGGSFGEAAQAVLDRNDRPAR